MNDRQRIRAKIADYAADPKAHAHQVKMLKGRDGLSYDFPSSLSDLAL